LSPVVEAALQLTGNRVCVPDTQSCTGSPGQKKLEAMQKELTRQKFAFNLRKKQLFITDLW
jgi:hypothetical protein